MARTLAREPLFAELIKPVIDMHALLVSIESASERLVDSAAFHNTSTVEAFWTQKNKEMNAIVSAAESAIGLARRALPAE